ncbi:MAG: hypothetical protein ACJKTH_01170 [Patescibacteria group bacterium UBA2163]
MYHTRHRMHSKTPLHTHVTGGYFVVLVLVFSAVFFTLISALSGYIFVQKRAQLAQENNEKALHIAEAGLEYYRWFLAHFPGDLQNATGNEGPYEHSVTDPEGGVLGTFSLDIEGEVSCGASSGIVIESTGWTKASPTHTRTVRARYTQPVVAEFSYIVDSNVWAGDDRIINGPYHANGGIRMDATHNSPVTSGQETWTCYAGDFGCGSTQTKDGVFGDGSNPELWDFPVPLVDFEGITVDMDVLEDYARHEGGVYYGQAGGQSNRRGYHVTFNGDDTATIRRVTNTTPVYSYNSADGWGYEYNIIKNEQFLETITIPESCPVLFFKDRVWVDGVVSGKVVLVAANLQSPQYDVDVILNGNLTYATGSINDGITVIAEENVLVGLTTPDVMSIRGVFIAQEGRFGRNHYSTSYLSSSLDPYVTRSTLNTTGTVVSRDRVGTKWVYSDGSFASGYSQRNDSYDSGLAANPPPFTPSISNSYKLRLWEEVE